MAKLIYQENNVQLASDDTVLAALLRHGVDVPHSCKTGVCQSCIVRSDGKLPPSQAQTGLKETLAAQGYFLACQCKLSEVDDAEIRVSLDDNDALFVAATLAAKDFVSADVVRLEFALESSMSIEPGQFVHLRRSDGLVRSYSVASGPGATRLELHVGRVQNGAMSAYLLDELAIGDTIDCRGPSGGCFYVAGRPEQPLLLVGTGTGLAPLLGIVRSAIAEGHSGPMHLFHGSVSATGLYLVDELRELASQHSNLHYTPCVDEAPPNVLNDLGLTLGRAADIALEKHSSLKGWRIFLCGHPAMVRSTKKRGFLAGAAISDIFADPFEVSPPPDVVNGPLAMA